MIIIDLKHSTNEGEATKLAISKPKLAHGNAYVF